MDSAATETVSSEQRSLSDLPTDIIQSIVSCISYADYPRFASVCKEWSQTVPQVYPAHKSPLLMHYTKKDRRRCRYYSPYFKKIFIVDSPLNFFGSELLYSKDGWIAFFQRSELVLARALTWTTHRFQVDDEFHDGYVAFSRDPSSSDCIIFFISSRWEDSVEIGVIQGENWNNRTTLFFNNASPFVMSSFSNPVFLHGQFYCLGGEGNLGVFDPRVNTWTVLAKPEKPDVCFERNFLVESKGDLLSVFVGKHDSSVHIFRLNQHDMVWEKHESLGDEALFVGWPMSMSATTSRRMRNKLYFPRLRGDPELIEADVRISQNQVFFVPKLRDKKQDLKEAKDCCWGISYCDLENRETFNHLKSEEFMHGIWFEPKA